MICELFNFALLCFVFSGLSLSIYISSSTLLVKKGDGLLLWLSKTLFGFREDARFVFKRIPDQVRDSDEYIKAVFVILQHLWNSEYERVWHCLETTTWSEKGTLSMLNSFKLVLRQKVMDLVEQTYKDIEQIALASLLGVPVNEACKAAQERHWVVEDSTGLVVPKRREREDLGIEASGSLGGRELEKIVKYAIYLQSGQAPASLHSE